MVGRAECREGLFRSRMQISFANGPAHPTTIETIARLSARWQLDPLSFENKWFGIPYTDWQKSWIELFYTPNPFASPSYPSNLSISNGE